MRLHRVFPRSVFETDIRIARFSDCFDAAAHLGDEVRKLRVFSNPSILLGVERYWWLYVIGRDIVLPKSV
uniref:Uncharacterized protein n=1 Tax=Pararge aegeria TaxID=116150 RepID=S4NM49_9NEOP